MINEKMRRALKLILIGSICFCHSNWLNAQSISPSKIVFLQLRMKNDSIVLIKSSVKIGKLKERHVPEEVGKILFVLESDEGAELYSNVINNPLVLRYEYPKNDQGELETTIEKRNEAEFWIRFPLKEGIKRISFYRIDSTQNKRANKNDLTLLGKINLQLNDVRSR